MPGRKRLLRRRRIVEAIRPDDFTALRQHYVETDGLVGLKNRIDRMTMLFKFVYDTDVFVAPMKYGPDLLTPVPKGDTPKPHSQDARKLGRSAA